VLGEQNGQSATVPALVQIRAAAGARDATRRAWPNAVAPAARRPQAAEPRGRGVTDAGTASSCAVDLPGLWDDGRGLCPPASCATLRTRTAAHHQVVARRSNQGTASMGTKCYWRSPSKRTFSASVTRLVNAWNFRISGSGGHHRTQHSTAQG
jgi:hypothetical protein